MTESKQEMGFVKKLWNRMIGNCEHPHTIVVSSVGVERTVCENCGHISFHITDETHQSTKATVKRDLPQASGI